MFTKKLMIAASVALAMAGCGGGGSDNSEPTTSVSGTLVDGYLAGATVCVDANANGKCDTGEASATTNASGAFTIAGVKTSVASSSPLVAEVPSTAVDAETSAAVGSGFVLSTPAGKTVISPLTTLVQQKMQKTSGTTASAAATEVQAEIASLASTDLFADYVAKSDANAHEAAKVVANSLKANYDNAKAYATGKDKDLAIVLGEVAKDALQSQGGTPNSTLPVGVEDSNTLRAAVAARSTASATQSVTISFDLANLGSQVRCGDAITVANTALWDHSTDTKLTTPGAIGAQSTAGKLVDTRFYVSNVLLIDASGNAVPLVFADNGAYQSANGLALIDFGYLNGTSCTTTYNTTITGKVPAGTYTGISLTIGVPIRSADFSTKLNHINTADTSAPGPLQNAAMAWSWQSGRKFTKFEFQPDVAIDKIGTATTTKWNVHIGSTGCAGDPTVATNETSCTNPNRLALKFDAFNAATQKIVLDVGQLFRQADLSFEGGGAAGCMSGTTDPECAPIFKAMGIDITTGKTLSGAGAQTVFSVQ